MGEKRVAKWYFGGLASAGAACFTHPLDLIKVQLQTQQDKKVSVFRLVGAMMKNDGIFSLYNGISASLLRQLTYSTARFGIYEIAKSRLSSHGEKVSFGKRVMIAGMAGAAGGVVGTPADLVNVRMQNDMKLPREQRRKFPWPLFIQKASVVSSEEDSSMSGETLARNVATRSKPEETTEAFCINYKNAVDGLWRVAREEGPLKMFNGVSAATSRAIFMTIGQLSFYDLFKDFLLGSGYFSDNPTTHFLSSLGAGGVATTLTQPLDVIKTRAMNAKPGEFKGLMDIALYTAKLGPLGFFKGYVPAFIRLAPQTILTFMLLEQLTENFGVIHSLNHI